MDVKLDMGELQRIVKDLGANVEKVCVSLAFDIEGEAKQLAAVDTGAMRASIYTVTQHENGHNRAAAEASKLQAGVVVDVLPVPTGKIFANVGPSVEYAEFVELGTSRQAAQPFLTPAVERIAKKLNDGETWKELFE